MSISGVTDVVIPLIFTLILNFVLKNTWLKTREFLYIQV